uniref:Uncharacterized protein n=1 Tax=Ditylenchus dipsaci TaxID=166011 RepID=A0A915ED34_9BILA
MSENAVYIGQSFQYTLLYFAFICSWFRTIFDKICVSKKPYSGILSIQFTKPKTTAQGQPWVTPPPIPHIYQPLQPVNGQTSRTAVPEHHEHISSFHSSRHRIAEPSESMQEEDDKQMNSQLNTPTRFSSKNGANEDKASSFRRPATSQIMSGSGNYNGVGVGSGFGIGIPGVGPIGVNSGLGVGVPGLSGGGSRGGGGGLFGIGSSTGVSAPFVGNIGVSSGLGIG